LQKLLSVFKFNVKQSADIRHCGEEHDGLQRVPVDPCAKSFCKQAELFLPHDIHEFDIRLGLARDQKDFKAVGEGAADDACHEGARDNSKGFSPLEVLKMLLLDVLDNTLVNAELDRYHSGEHHQVRRPAFVQAQKPVCRDLLLERVEQALVSKHPVTRLKS